MSDRDKDGDRERKHREILEEITRRKCKVEQTEAVTRNIER
jgi:hypothetical protein